MTKIAVIDYGVGNLRSVVKAFGRMGTEVILTSSPSELVSCDVIVLPGVGAFGDGISNLKNLGFVEVLNDEVKKDGKPFFGICLGMQLLAKSSSEMGNNEGLGWIDAKIDKFSFSENSLRVPHMGWDEIHPRTGSEIFEGLDDHPSFYFAHSYHMMCENILDVSSTCEYGYRFPASVEHKNIFGVQFHPEKSQKNGLKLLRNFMTVARR
jgi:glutamine amidotransferase